MFSKFFQNGFVNKNTFFAIKICLLRTLDENQGSFTFVQTDNLKRLYWSSKCEKFAEINKIRGYSCIAVGMCT